MSGLIRPELPGDRPFWREILRMVALESYPELSALGRLTLQERLESLEAQYLVGERRRWVSLDADRAVGGLWLNLGHHPVTEESEGVIVAIAVLETHRGRGIARALLAHAAAEARALGLASLRLFVNPANPAAMRLYDCLGFETLTCERRWRL